MAVIEIKGEILDGAYLNFLMKYQACGVEQIDLYIDSVGGLVTEGNDIADFISKKQASFSSVRNSGNVCSIASTIFLALPIEKRFFDVSKGVAVIHFPMLPMDGNFRAEELQSLAIEAKQIQDQLSKEISKQTGSPIELVTAIMAKDEPMTKEQMQAINFANIIGEAQLSPVAIKAVAYYNVNQINTNEMKKEEVESLFEEREKSLLEKFKALFVPKFKAVTLTDAKGIIVDFPEVADGIEPMVGDKATIDGIPVPDGDITFADGEVYTFVGGVVTVITEVAPEPTPEPLDEAAITAMVEARAVAMVESKLKEMKSIWIDEAILAHEAKDKEGESTEKFSYKGKKK